MGFSFACGIQTLSIEAQGMITVQVELGGAKDDAAAQVDPLEWVCCLFVISDMSHSYSSHSEHYKPQL